MTDTPREDSLATTEVTSGPPSSPEQRDEYLRIKGEEWYTRGFRKPHELARMLGIAPDEAQMVIADIETRMAARLNTTPSNVKAQLAYEREEEHYRRCWQVFTSTTNTEERIKALAELGKINERMTKLMGITDSEAKATYYSNMLMSFLLDMREMLDSVNDPVILARFQQVTARYLNPQGRSPGLPGVIDVGGRRN